MDLNHPQSTRAWTGFSLTVSSQPVNPIERGVAEGGELCWVVWGWCDRWELSTVLVAARQLHFLSSAPASRTCPAGSGPGLGMHICEAPVQLWGRNLLHRPWHQCSPSGVTQPTYQGLSSENWGFQIQSCSCSCIR